MAAAVTLSLPPSPTVSVGAQAAAYKGPAVVLPATGLEALTLPRPLAAIPAAAAPAETKKAAPGAQAALGGMAAHAGAAAQANEDPKAGLDAGFDAAKAAAGPVELVGPGLPGPDKSSFARALKSGMLAYGAELTSANPVTAKSLSGHRGLGALVLDAGKAERGTLAGVVKAVQGTALSVLGRFSSADDPFLKPKLDEGLGGALLEGAESLKEVVKFLNRLYLPPLGERSVGPSDVTEYLSRQAEFLANANDAFVGGVTIGSAKGAANIASIVKAKERGLRLIEVDAAKLTAEQAAAVEAAALAAGIPLAGRAASREEARAMHARGYRFVTLLSDAGAVNQSLSNFEDVPRDASVEAARGGTVRSWLKSGLTGFLGFLNSPDPGLAEVFARRAHGVWIDAEAGQFPLSSIAAVIRSLPAGTPAVVRTTQYDNPDIAAYIAAGAEAVVAPQVNNALQAAAFVKAVKAAHPDALAIVMIETKRGLANVEEIAAVPGLDALFVGPHDLSLSMGAAKTDARFAAALARIEAAAARSGVPLGGLASRRSEAYAMRARGYRLLATVMDQAAIIARLRKLLGP
jgi:4-hydroxy-2-oxoheptanedioate aldolase